jgi:Family of unknown function (DUF6335)
MAKRKAARSSGRKSARKRAGAKRSRSTARKTAARRRRSVRKTVRRRARTATMRAARKTTKRKAAARKASARKTSAKRAAPRKRPHTPKTRTVVARKTPALNRERRTIPDDDLVPTPPSSLDLDRSASAVRTGRRELRERFEKHTETSPALTGGDVDADWESAYTVGDEAPGGDNPTPDQDIVDDIGRALGVEYQDNEELKGEKKISDRDRHRWELDPASAEDYDEK